MFGTILVDDDVARYNAIGSVASRPVYTGPKFRSSVAGKSAWLVILATRRPANTIDDLVFLGRGQCVEQARQSAGRRVSGMQSIHCRVQYNIDGFVQDCVNFTAFAVGLARLVQTHRYDIVFKEDHNKGWQWNENIIILVKFSSLATPEVVILTTSGAANDENFVKMTFPFQWSTDKTLSS